MNAHNHSKLAGVPSEPPPVLGTPATFSLSKLLEDARRFEVTRADEGELSYLCNIAENLLRARPGDYAEECLRDFLSSLESALENEAEDRRFNGAERVEF